MVGLFHGRVLWLWVLCVRGGCGVVVPLTFIISLSIWFDGLSNHIVLSSNSPVLCAFFIVIVSPLSVISNPHLLACLYTSALLLYSNGDRYMLHFMGPLLLLIASYNSLSADFDAHSMAMRFSPNGVATLVHPVRRENLSASYFDSNLFQSSTSP